MLGENYMTTSVTLMGAGGGGAGVGGWALNENAVKRGLTLPTVIFINSLSYLLLSQSLHADEINNINNIITADV